VPNPYPAEFWTNSRDQRSLVIRLGGYVNFTDPANQPGGGTLTVTDGVHTVDDVGELDFIAGATVSDEGGGIAGATVTGGGGGLPVGWTQDGVTDTVTVTLSDPDQTPLQFKPGTGATANATNQIEFYDEDGNLFGYIDAVGNLNVTALAGQGGGFTYSSGGGSFVRATGTSAELGDGTGREVGVTDNGINVSTDALGFYDVAPIARPVVPLTVPTVQNVITALVALGLIVQHD
jgi:hypothetical protein